jgi:hypothetical protein
MKVTRTEILPGVTLYHVRRDGSQPGRPWPKTERITGGLGDDSYLVERLYLILFGLKIVWSEYSHATPAASGAPVGILRSWWIYTARRAYGRGLVVDLAKLQSIELKIGDSAPIVTEAGFFKLSPPITPKAEDIEVRIHNRNHVRALGYISFIGTQRAYNTREVKFLDTPKASGRLQFAVDAGKQRTVRPIISPLDTITAVAYATEPDYLKRNRRIYGRPEWLD